MQNAGKPVDVASEKELNDDLKAMETVFVLFYASWCPYSNRFLPVFTKWAEENPQKCLRVMIDDLESVCDKYQIEVYPTVLYFEKGQVSKRLDGKPGVGLNIKNLTDFVKICKV